MERVKKTFFEPLATSKEQIRDLLNTKPVGSAHPFSPEHILLCRTEHGIDEIDISGYPEDFFFNAVDLGEMGEVLLRRMAGFPQHLSVFSKFEIQQAPASTFKVPLVSDQITILAVSERTPTYYDFCFADDSYKTCCWTVRNTFPGISHSGDLLNNQDLLDYVKINAETLTHQEICVFISGYQKTKITRFLGTHPALLVANHVDKVLYIIPVPLDEATIGDATLCCPLVFKRDGDSIICSILAKATTERGMMCSTEKTVSPCFAEAIRRADFTMAMETRPEISADAGENRSMVKPTSDALNSANMRQILSRDKLVLTTNVDSLLSQLRSESTQVAQFRNGLEFQSGNHGLTSAQSTVVLPCIFGAQLQGPVLLTMGLVPVNVPFTDQKTICNYYNQLKSVVVVVDDAMTDNARNLAPSLRMNALFIVQVKTTEEPKSNDDLIQFLNSVNINAVTALAGPQSLVVIHAFGKLFFYRGIADRQVLKTSELEFGADVTSVLESNIFSMVDQRVPRVTDLATANTVLLPTTGQLVRPEALKQILQDISIDDIDGLEEDICAAIPQLQALLTQKQVQELSQQLVAIISAKVSDVVAPMRSAYIEFLLNGFNSEDNELVKKKNRMLGDLRKRTKEVQGKLEVAISSLSNMMSAQTTSKRTHDLKRLERQAKIQSNVETAKEMSFDSLAEYLEQHASEMGVLLLNINTGPYRSLLANLTHEIDANPCCDLDSRVLHLEGLDAGIVISQAQNSHCGPLQSQLGPTQPILALPYLNQRAGQGSMLAWVCWDEFVNLNNPYAVRWMEKCNVPHIAALRIIMRSTLSQAVASREYNFTSASIEIGQLMSNLLIAAMSKLAAMRKSPPPVSEDAEDTVTKLMRGLFGNLMTIAGSGVRPLSMVWQLWGTESLFDIPSTKIDWMWYEAVVTLAPYTGWNLEQFHENLEAFLDKVIVRVITKNENTNELKANRAAEMVKYCQLRNIQLDHSRTITTFMRMLTTENVDIPLIATRLLHRLPPKLEKQTRSYTRMLKYLRHLATGADRISKDDLVAASVYTKRSAAFARLKQEVSDSCGTKDWLEVKTKCQKLLEKHAETATLWNLEPENLPLQSLDTYKALMNADFGDDEESKKTVRDLVGRVISDAEKSRIPWQVGKVGQFGDNIEPLDENFVHEIMTGVKLDRAPAAEWDLTAPTTTESVQLDAFEEFKSITKSQFISTMQKDLSAEDVCEIIGVPIRVMRAFIRALNPGFLWKDLTGNFKSVIIDLLRHRSNRLERCPSRQLLELKMGEAVMEITE